MISEIEYLSKILVEYPMQELIPHTTISINKKGYVSTWDSNAEIIFGWKEAEVQDKLIDNILNVEILEFAYQLEDSTNFIDKMSDFFELSDKYGNNLLVYITISKLEDIGFSIECKDITEKNYFINKIKKQKDELSILSHRLFHELRNALNNIENSAVLLKLQDDTFFDKNKILNTIIINVNTINILLKKSIQLANTGKIIGKKYPSQIEKIIEDTIKIVDPSFDFNIGKFPLILADGDILFHVFKNIIENNIVHGASSSISIEGLYKSNTYEILISNNGKQIPSELIGKMLTDQTPGLGMKIVNRILTAHHWQLEITSSQKRTAFIIKIPLKDVIEY